MSKTKVLAFFNSPYVGGAERSFIQQLNQISFSSDVSIFIPSLNEVNNTKLLEELTKSKLEGVKEIPYPESLFSFSRSGALSILDLIKTPFQIILSFIKLKKVLSLTTYDVIWCNGNKISFLILIFAKLSSYKGKFYWHFRDYPTARFPFSFIWKWINREVKISLTLITNSYSVKDEVLKLMPNAKTFVLYNCVSSNSSLNQSKSINKISKVGLVSMMAPWKGVHQALYFCQLYQDNLKKIGITEINIYGGDLYKTAGSHEGYFEQLKSYKEVHNLDIINFKGFKDPSEIFDEIDLLLHTSIEPEPFGRVITEAFMNKVIVASTCLGGSRELIDNNKNGYKLISHDYLQWLNTIEEIVKLSPQEIKKVQGNAFIKFQEIEEMAINNIKELV